MAQKRRRRRRGEVGRKKSGVMIGMRRGFKKAATKVTGADDKAAGHKKKSSWVSTAVTIVLVIAAIAFIFYRNR